MSGTQTYGLNTLYNLFSSCQVSFVPGTVANSKKSDDEVSTSSNSGANAAVMPHDPSTISHEPTEAQFSSYVADASAAQTGGIASQSSGAANTQQSSGGTVAYGTNGKPIPDPKSKIDSKVGIPVSTVVA